MENASKLVILFFLIISPVFSYSQETDKKKIKDYSLSTLFTSKNPLSFELYVDKKKLFKDVGEERKFHPALIRYRTNNNYLKEVNLKIQTRGNIRRNPDVCNMHPLFFKFSKNEKDSNNVFAAQRKLKLVIPCAQKSNKSQEYVILEYLCYQIYELLTPASYRTRLVNIALIDSIKTKDTLKFTGFFLEESDQLAQRNKGTVKELKRYHPEHVDREQMTLVNVFEFLIGNTDWSVEVCHNIKLLFIGRSVIPYAVPYDFDMCGIVDASYAIPAPQIGTTSVKTRVFRGYKRKIEEYDPIIKLFNDKKEEIYNVFKSCNLISEKTKKNTLSYIDEFYEIINNPKKIKNEFIDKSRKP